MTVNVSQIAETVAKVSAAVKAFLAEVEQFEAMLNPFLGQNAPVVDAGVKAAEDVAAGVDAAATDLANGETK